jgi:hypothetical protein
VSTHTHTHTHTQTHTHTHTHGQHLLVLSDHLIEQFDFGTAGFRFALPCIEACSDFTLISSRKTQRHQKLVQLLTAFKHSHNHSHRIKDKRTKRNPYLFSFKGKASNRLCFRRNSPSAFESCLEASSARLFAESILPFALCNHLRCVKSAAVRRGSKLRVYRLFTDAWLHHFHFRSGCPQHMPLVHEISMEAVEVARTNFGTEFFLAA